MSAAKFNWLKLAFCLLLTAVQGQPNNDEDQFKYYEKLNYLTLRSRLLALKQQFPDVIQLKTSTDYGLDYQAICENNKKCILDVVSVTDPQAANDNKVQVFISG